MQARHLFAIAASTIALAAPTISAASSAVHFVGGELAYVEHPGFVKSTRSRAEVRAELDAARQDGSLLAQHLGTQFSLPVVAAHTGPARTRAQVQAELHSETPAQRAARMATYSNGG